MSTTPTSDSMKLRGARAAREELVPIESAYFYTGMNIDFSVYMKIGNNANVLCNNVVLDDELIKKMDLIEDAGSCLCVTRANYKKVLLNAAKRAEEEGEEIDWQQVTTAVDNPETFKTRIEVDAETEEPIPAPDFKPKTAPKPAPVPDVPGASNADRRLAAAAAALEAAEASTFKPLKKATGDSFVPEALAEKFRKNYTADKKVNDHIGKHGTIATPINTADRDGHKISDAKRREIEQTIKTVEKYQEISIGVDALLASSMKNYTIDRKTLDEAALQITELAAYSPQAAVVQCLKSLRDVDSDLITHTQNVACMNVLIGRWLELSHGQMVSLAKIGLLHDTGKQQIPDKILYKPGKLTDEEFKAIKQHPVHSYNIAVASGIQEKSILAGIRNHHERINGGGYPDGLKGDDISFSARITAVSDVYDAMVTSKPYKENNSPLDAIAEFANSRFSELDTKIVNLVLTHMAEIFSDVQAVLEDGRTGQIVSLNSSDYAHPIVRIGNEFVKTDKYLKVVALNNFIEFR